MQGATKKIRETIERLKASDINGCITGSSMTGFDFDDWDSVPDVDVFVYDRNELMYAVGLLIGSGEFEYKSEGEAQKVLWMRQGSYNRKYNLDTVKLVHDGIELNITWKKNCRSLLNVLASFDMTIIMVGYDIPRGILVDLRTGPSIIPDDEKGKWPSSNIVAYPNPLLLIHDTVFDVQYATRQFDRVIKYYGRGFDTMPMAKFYVDKIDAVIEKGALFKTQTSIEVYESFVEEQSEMREKIVEWMTDKEEV